ncbi:MAG TPA: BatD family protein [Anaeromyxobacter sp.]
MRRRAGELAAIALACAAAVSPARAGDRAWHGWERDLRLELEVDRREVFLGEQVTAAVWLLSPLGLVDYSGYRPPLLDGFWAEELETPRRLAWQVRRVGGVPLRAYLVQRLALFPTRAGDTVLGSFELDAAVRVGSDEPSESSADVRRVHRRSTPVALTVKPLPEGAPAGFVSVNVGSFALEASAAEPRVRAGELVAIRVSASGEGNLRALSLPPLPAIGDARAFEPTESEALRGKGTRLAGTRTRETVLVPEREGTLVVPPLAWPCFDPRSGRYEVLRTAEVRVEVLPSPAAEAPAPAADPLAAALRPVRTDGRLGPRPAAPWRGTAFAAVGAVPPLLFGAFALAGAARRRARAAGPERRALRAGRTARRTLRAARRRLGAGNPAGALALAERALAGFASDRLGRPVGGLTRAALGAALSDARARPGGARALAAALDACDAARFGGGAPDAALALAEEALAALDGEEEP